MEIVTETRYKCDNCRYKCECEYDIQRCVKCNKEVCRDCGLVIYTVEELVYDSSEDTIEPKAMDKITWCSDCIPEDVHDIYKVEVDKILAETNKSLEILSETLKNKI